MDRIKKLKIKKQDDTYTDYIPIGADAENIDTADGESVEIKLNKKPYYYNNIASMKNDLKLKAGDMAVTLGYYNVNDGGNGEYRIVSGTHTDDGGSYHQLNNNLYAELIIKNSEIKVAQFGINSNSNTNLTNLINYVNNSNYSTLVFEKLNYTLDERMKFVKDDFVIKGNGAKILVGLQNGRKNIFEIVSSNSCIIENLTIDGSDGVQDQWDESVLANIWIRTAFNINCPRVTVRDVNISNIWGEGFQLYNYNEVLFENCILDKIGGGWYKTDAATGGNDHFGDAFYFSGHHGVANVRLQNVKAIGYRKDEDAKGSRGGVVLENLASGYGDIGNTYLTIEDSTFLYFNRFIHQEVYQANVSIIFRNGEIYQDASIGWSNSYPPSLYIEKSIITHSKQSYNGTRGFRGIKLHMKDCVVNLDTQASYALGQSGKGTIDLIYEDCIFNNFCANALFSNCLAELRRCTINTVYEATTYLNYNSTVMLKDCIIKDSSPDQIHTYSGAGSRFTLQNCKCYNIVLYHYDSTPQGNVFYLTTESSISNILYLKPSVYGNATVYLNNNLVSTPSIGSVLDSDSILNIDNIWGGARSLSSEAVLPIFPDTLPLICSFKKNVRYLLFIQGHEDPNVQKFAINFSQGYYLIANINAQGVWTIESSSVKSIGNPPGAARSLSFNLTDKTVQRGSTYSTYASNLMVWFIPIKDAMDIKGLDLTL